MTLSEMNILRELTSILCRNSYLAKAYFSANHTNETKTKFIFPPKWKAFEMFKLMQIIELGKMPNASELRICLFLQGLIEKFRIIQSKKVFSNRLE